MKEIYFILTFCSAFSNLCLGQDSIRIDSELSIETKGQHNLAAIANDFKCFNCLSGTIKDNPFFHLAIYTGIDYKLTLDNKYRLHL